MVNKLMIQSRLALINDCLLQLERHATVRREDFVGDKDRVAATKRVLNNSPLWRGAREGGVVAKPSCATEQEGLIQVKKVGRSHDEKPAEVSIWSYTAQG